MSAGRNAAHNRPLLLPPDAPPMFLSDPRNPIAGMVPGLEYSAGRRDFPPGSLLLMAVPRVRVLAAANPRPC